MPPSIYVTDLTVSHSPATLPTGTGMLFALDADTGGEVSAADGSSLPLRFLMTRGQVVTGAPGLIV